ncbi:MAG: purine-nucleoside phosphorylase [Balneolaceae bacterium]|nr:purine-nucleoside phosphorylase [Balneolaceae bacterium]
MPVPDSLYELIGYLKEQQLPESPEAAIILGSGLGAFTEQIHIAGSIPYDSIPNFPVSSVEGHDGELIHGSVAGKPVIAFSGRFHHYEGYTFEQTALPVYIASGLNAQKLIISNAAGAINRGFKVGDMMVIDDILRHNKTILPRGHDQFRYTHYPAADRTREIAAELGLSVQRGTYAYVTGPNYETKAEIRALRVMGADAVGMSTATELAEAARLRLRAVAISVISNMASGVSHGKLDHGEVAEAASLRKEDFARLVTALVERL